MRENPLACHVLLEHRLEIDSVDTIANVLICHLILPFGVGTARNALVLRATTIASICGTRGDGHALAMLDRSTACRVTSSASSQRCTGRDAPVVCCGVPERLVSPRPQRWPIGGSMKGPTTDDRAGPRTRCYLPALNKSTGGALPRIASLGSNRSAVVCAGCTSESIRRISRTFLFVFTNGKVPGDFTDC